MNIEGSVCDVTFSTDCNELIYPGLRLTELGSTFFRISSSRDVFGPFIDTVATADLVYETQSDGSFSLDFVNGSYFIGHFAPPGLMYDLRVEHDVVVEKSTEVYTGTAETHLCSHHSTYNLLLIYRFSRLLRYCQLV